LWEYNNPDVSGFISSFPTNFSKFLKETKPTRGMKVNFVDPELKLPWVGLEYPKDIMPARDPNFNGSYDMQEYLQNPSNDFTDIFGRGERDQRFNRGIFSSGLKPGDEIYRGVSEGTYDLGLKYPREVGPHHSTLADVAEFDFASPYKNSPTGGQSVKSIWEGTGQGYHVEEDLGHWSIPNIVNGLKDDNLLPKRYIEELQDLKLRYNEAKRNVTWDDDSAGNMVEKAASQEFGKIMQDAGYDHFTYMNTHEGPGHISTIPIYPYKFKPVENTYFPYRGDQDYLDNLDNQIDASLITPKEKYETIMKDFLSELNPYPPKPLLSEYDVVEGVAPTQKEVIDLADLLSKYGLWK
jgi:hypothetical protein